MSEKKEADKKLACVFCGSTHAGRWFDGPKCGPCKDKGVDFSNAPTPCVRCGKKKMCRSKQMCSPCYEIVFNPDKIQERQNRFSKSLKGLFKIGKDQAKNRKMHWGLSLGQFAEFRNKPCFYCGGSLPQLGTGLDRIHPEKEVGYIIDNVVSCCKMCSAIRGDKLSVSETKIAALEILEQKDRIFTAYHEHDVHLDERLVFIGQDIDEKMAGRFIKAFDELESINSTAKITVQIMSQGGNYTDALAMYERILASPCHVTTIATGTVASAATVIFQAGDERLITPLATFMVHDGMEGYEGDPKSFEEWARISKKHRQLMYSIYSNRSGKAQSYWEDKCKSDTVFSAEETVQEGLADKILEPRKHFNKKG